MSLQERSFSSSATPRREYPKRERVPSFAQKREALIRPPSEDAFRADSQRLREDLDRLGSALDEKTYDAWLNAEIQEEQDRKLGKDYDAEIERQMNKEEEERAIEKATRELQARINAEIAAHPQDYDGDDDSIELMSDHDPNNDDSGRFGGTPPPLRRVTEREQPELIEELDNDLLEEIPSTPSAEERFRLRQENNPLRNFRGFPRPITPASGVLRPEITPVVSEKERTRHELALRLAQKKLEQSALEQRLEALQRTFSIKHGVDPMAHAANTRSFFGRLGDRSRLLAAGLFHRFTGSAEPSPKEALAEIQKLDQETRRVADEVAERQKNLRDLDEKPTNAASTDVASSGIGREYAAASRDRLIQGKPQPLDDAQFYGNDTWRDRERTYRGIARTLQGDALWGDASSKMAAAGAAFMDTGDDQSRLAEERYKKIARANESTRLWNTPLEEHVDRGFPSPIEDAPLPPSSSATRAPTLDSAYFNPSRAPLEVPEPSEALVARPLPEKKRKTYSIPETRQDAETEDDRPTPEDTAAALAAYKNVRESTTGRSATYREKDAYLNHVAMGEFRDAVERNPLLREMASGRSEQKKDRERIVAEMKNAFSRRLERELSLAYSQEIGSGEDSSTPEAVKARVQEEISELFEGVRAWRAVEEIATGAKEGINASLQALENLIRPTEGGRQERELRAIEKDLNGFLDKACRRYVSGFPQEGAEALKTAQAWQYALEESASLAQHAVDTLEAQPSSRHTIAVEALLDQLIVTIQDTLKDRRRPSEVVDLLASELRYQSNNLNIPLFQNDDHSAIKA